MKINIVPPLKLVKAATVFALVFVIYFPASGQVMLTESFNQLPMPSQILPPGWKQQKIIGTGATNIFERYSVGTNPGCSPHSGAGMVRYGTWGIAAGNEDALISKPYDLSSRPAGVSSNTRLWMYRDNGWAGLADRIELYVNTVPNIIGATLLTDTANGLTTINRDRNMAPVVAANGWYMYGFTIPSGATFSVSKVYVIIKGISGFGNNMFFDDFSITTYPSNQVFVSTNMVFQNTACASPGTNGWVICSRIVTNGAANPYGLDSIKFNVNGTTAPCSDVIANGARLWWTGGSKVFDLSIAQQVGGAANVCNNTFKFIPSASFRLDNDTNYFWLTYEVAGNAVAGNCLDAQYVLVDLAYGASGNNVKIPTVATITGCRQIGPCPWCIPISIAGTSSGDYINHIILVGEPTFPPGINNATGANTNPDYYQSYAAVPGLTAVLKADNSTSYTLQVQTGSYFSGNCIAAWIDYNNDGDFFDAGEKIGQTPYPPGLATNTWANFSFAVPSNGYAGNVSLRVREVWINNNINPCSTYTYGETEDYTVTLLQCPPVANVTPSGSLTFCSGDVTLNVNTGTGYTHQWFKNGIAISGATSASYTPNSSGSYTVQITNSCGSSLSAPVIATVNPLPNASITSSGPVSFCQGDSVVLNANAGTNLSYKWKLNGGFISGAVSSSYTAKISGTYTVVVTKTTTGCTKESPSAVTVTVNPKPQATITPAGTITFCAGQSALLTASSGTGYTYKWKKNGNYISGAIAQTYTVTTAGKYKAEVTASSGCSKTSPADTVVVPCRIGEREPGSPLEMTVAPNPSDGIFTVYFSEKPAAPVVIECTDVLGNVVSKLRLNEQSIRIDNSAFLPGVYCVKAQIGETIFVKRIIIQ